MLPCGRRAILSALLLVLACGVAQAAPAPILSTDILEPFTLPYDTTLRPWTVYLPLDDASSPGVDATGNEPTQVHLSLAGDDSFYVMWATGQYTVGKGSLAASELTPSIVQYGMSHDDLSMTANGTAEVYDQIYTETVGALNLTNALNYSSPVLHTVVLEGLEPNMTYYYTVGDGETTSEVFSFRSLAAVGEAAYPQRIATIADWGYSSNSSSTLDHILQSVSSEENANPPVIFYIGDYCYADGWLANGTASGTATSSASGYEGATSDTYQPVWDAWMRFIQPLVAEVPMVGAVGNHEIEQQYDADTTIFKSVSSRWAVRPESGSYHFHSHEFGAVHAVFLSVYTDYTPGSPQWNWLWSDLAGVNRTKTPWVIVNLHNPWFTTDSSYKQFEQMRVSMEPITYQYGVDVFYYGHVHSYERTAPMYNYNIDPCGAVHITIGDGGNSEGLSGLNGPDAYPYTEPYYEDYGGCPNVTASNRASFLHLAPGNTSDPFAYYKTTLTFQADGNSTGPPGMYPDGYCYKSQPAWSQYRESSFGHGTLDVLNTTHALWSWHRNQDAEAVATDQTYIIRNTTACPSRLGSQAYSVAGSGIAPPPGMSIANAGK